MTKAQTISVIINSGNEEREIGPCLESVGQMADEIIVCLSQLSNDKTGEIAREHEAKVIVQEPVEMNYAAWHNQGMKIAKGGWLLWVDADERIPLPLKEEILSVLNNSQYSAYAIPRRNFLLGKELHWGGWYPDYAKRLFRKNDLKRWEGELHEQPIFSGDLGKLKNPMLHYQPEKIEPALQKSIRWSGLETGLLFKANHPKSTWWKVLRMGLTTLFERLIKKQGFRDGVEGWIESIYQSFHTMIVYLRLWELQHQ